MDRKILILKCLWMMINIKIDTTKKLNLRTIAKSTFANK